MSKTLHATAPIWRRLAALLYDSFILVALSFLYGAIVTAIAVNFGLDTQEYQPMFKDVFFPLGWAFTLIAFYCFFWHRSGQTLGMKTWHLYLVQDKTPDRPPTWRQCFIRAVIAAPSVLILGIGFIGAYFHPQRKSIQDIVSGTRVLIIPK